MSITPFSFPDVPHPFGNPEDVFGPEDSGFEESLGVDCRKAIVERVVDADTIRIVGNDDAIRLFGIDAPERNTADGQKAMARMREILPPGQTIELVFDPVRDWKDRYNRWLAIVFKPGQIGQDVDYGMVQTRLAADGLAVPYMPEKSTLSQYMPRIYWEGLSPTS